MADNLKIIFMGTPEIAATVLTALIDGDYAPTAVVTRPDKPKGRSDEPQESPTKFLAEKHNIKVFQPKTKIELEEFVQKEKPDLIVVCAFGMIITKDTLDVPRLQAINVHPSLLPKYRGPWPIGGPILAGDKKTGTTIMLMSEGMDEGDVLAQEELELKGDETTPELTIQMAELSAKLLLETLPKWIDEKIKPQKQKDTEATYTKMAKKEDGKVEWAKLTAEEIERMSRALLPWPGTYTHLNGKKIELYSLSVSKAINLAPGQTTAIDGQLYIGTKKGLVSPAFVKIEGKSKMATADFLRGHSEIADTKLD